MLKALKRRALQRLFEREFSWRLGEFTGDQLLPLDYPVDPTPRYPLGQSAHPQLLQWFDSQRGASEDMLRSIAGFRNQLEAIPRAAGEPTQPHWDNGWFSALDAMTLYSLVARRAPARIIEVGSGNSTRFAVRAIRDHGLSTHMTSIDPHPRAEIDSLCDQVVREPLERTDVTRIRELKAGDFLFIDSSHRVFTNSDVTTLFLDVLPHLAPGVIVHLHDIFLPWDYPEEWRGRYYSEQYLLASWLLAGPARWRLVMSSAFASQDLPLRTALAAAFAGSPLSSMLDVGAPPSSAASLLGASFWAEVAQGAA